MFLPRVKLLLSRVLEIRLTCGVQVPVHGVALRLLPHLVGFLPWRQLFAVHLWAIPRTSEGRRSPTEEKLNLLIITVHGLENLL